MNADDAQLEIAHVLFIDIVGYTKRLVNEQTALVRRVNEMVRASEQARVAEANGKLIRIPTGDGMALAFFTSPDAPLRCALELSRSLAAHPQLHLRMGIHSGPVDAVADVNDRPNVAGAGINMAQRVMDCGDAGHILLSKRAADDLGQYAEWKPHFHDLGEVSVGVVNFSRWQYRESCPSGKDPPPPKHGGAPAANRLVVRGDPARGRSRRRFGFNRTATGLRNPLFRHRQCLPLCPCRKRASPCCRSKI